MEPTVALTGNADAGTIIATVSQASPIGFLQILVFILIIGFGVWMWFERKDRLKHIEERDKQWADHDLEHEKSLHKIDMQDQRISELETNMQHVNGCQEKILEKVSEIQLSIARLEIHYGDKKQN